MRGGSWDTMSSTCVQSGGMPRTLGGGNYSSPHMMEARSPAPATAWHQLHGISTPVKQEPADHDFSAYGSGSDGSDHHSRDSIPTSLSYNQDSIQMNHYYSTPVQHRIPVSTVQHTFQHNSLTGFNPLTPPGFEPMVSPKIHGTTTNSVAMKSESANTGTIPGYAEIERDPNTTLTPCTTPPSEDTPPKSPKCTSDDGESHYYGKSDDEDHLRRLQMAFEKNGMLPTSPKRSESRDSDDCKSDYDIDEVDENGLRIPRINSHGKVKTFKCKQCDFIAVTKLDFWEHSKAHIKADKLLTCPKCPFVTEYKHHLEYHLRNHFGSKPFKCDKCSYSCVNKSMLNSHLKSHSNVYQYRCADCTYATKYCHSLKLHLRKYKHNPAMVLNPDGSPNPLPIIDVYGTRRGPKQKHQKDEPHIQSPSHAMLPQHPIFNHFMVPNGQQPLQIPFPWLGTFPGTLGNPLMFPQMGQLPLEQLSPNPSNERTSSPDSYKREEESPEPKIDEEEPVPASPDQPAAEGAAAAALDLSKPEIILPINVPDVPIQTPLAVPSVSKSRRKGRAFKLERVAVARPVTSDDDDEPEEKISKFETAVEIPKGKVLDTRKKSDIYNCQYCDITFRDIVMYTMHMGYHGYKDPFTCNMCGEQSGDKVAFFLHIARTSHS